MVHLAGDGRGFLCQGIVVLTMMMNSDVAPSVVVVVACYCYYLEEF